MERDLVLSAEKALVERMLSGFRRNDLLLMGEAHFARLIDDISASHTFFLDTTFPAEHQKPTIQAEFDQLPVQSESLDIVLCAHALDRVQRCDDVCADMFRVLKPDGKAILFGFNRWSWWRLFYFFAHEKFFQTDIHFHSMGALQHALEAAGFDVELQQTLCFRLPFQNKRWLFLETLGQLLFPSSGAVYMIMATKNVAGLTPLSLYLRKTSVSDVARA